MSKDWGYRCCQDGEVSETWFNHGEHILRSIARCWPHIRQVLETDDTGYIEIDIMAHSYESSEIWHFLWQHYEHGIELRNEYGGTEPLEEHDEEKDEKAIRSVED